MLDIIQKKNSSSEVASNPYICYVCGYRSSVERTKSGEFLCNECLKVWEGGKFYSSQAVRDASRDVSKDIWEGVDEV